MRIPFLLAAGCLAMPSFCAAERSAVFLTANDAERIRAAIARAEPWTVEPAKHLRADTARQMTLGPWSVTTSRPENLRTDAHDYYSEGTYWWPDPANPNGPYIRKDGHTYPGRFMDNKSAMNSMAEAVFTLGAAGYLLNDAAAADRAKRVAAVWCVDPATRMNPHLEYGQAVRGRNTGRGGGIIDTRVLIRAAQGVALLDLTGRLDATTRDGIHRWFHSYLEWLTTSKKGLDEKQSGNNHASWWTAQVAAFATLTGDRAASSMAERWFQEQIFARQITPTGAAPREEARTKSLGYSAFNLEAYTVMCRIAQSGGVNLWGVHTPQGATLDTVVRYLLPGLRDPGKWKGEQIVEFSRQDMYYLALAGVGLGKAEYIKPYREFEHPGSAWLAFVDLLVAR